MDWQRFKAIYSFDETAAQAVLLDRVSVRSKDYRLIPFRTVFLNGVVKQGDNVAMGCFFSVMPFDKESTALLTLYLESGGVVRNYVKLGGPDTEYDAHRFAHDRELFEGLIRPYLGLAKLLTSRNAEMKRDVVTSGRKGFGKTPQGWVEAWTVSYRKGADFVRWTPFTPGQPLLERPTAPGLKLLKKRSIRKHEQRYWKVCPDDPNWYIAVWVEKVAKIANAEAPGDLPATERDVPL